MAKATKIGRTKLIDREENQRDARLFIIATEGRETEKQYFSLFHSPRIKIEVLATGEDNQSAPQYVLTRLNKFVEKYALSSDDVLCIMFDVDRWTKKELSAICKEAKQKKYQLLVSNPCFEVWLYLHLDELNITGDRCEVFEKEIRHRLGSYNKSNLDLKFFQDCIEVAVKRAKDLHPSARQYWPNTPGSHVYRIVEIILQALQSETGDAEQLEGVSDDVQ
ncbi:RloB family protein [Oscillatoria sp. FACHB-1406]|uniref:RloB family protein n=1 Tax=Oscillatoria sp. FACHB-1406 TaxID=2692846 RepID=UPI001683CB8D|nr:RloB family protein [Oscillatoria sp. FACHB-1406]MBD2578866.1 RloB domain-containing protein [Oscillatoria sp. FACHB-1406]